MMSEDKDVEGLKQKLKECEDNLSQIAHMLENGGSNTELQAVHNELVEARKIFVEQIAAVTRHKQDELDPQQTEANIASVGGSILAEWALPEMHQNGPIPSAMRVLSEDPKEYLQEIVHPDEPPITGGFETTFIGQFVSVPQEGYQRVGKVVVVENNLLMINFIGNGDDVLTPVELRDASILRGLPLSALNLGARVKSAYSGDGFFYDCVVKEVTPSENGTHFIKVYYDEYDEEEVVTIERLQLTDTTKKSDAEAAQRSTGIDDMKDDMDDGENSGRKLSNGAKEDLIKTRGGFQFKASGKTYTTRAGYKIPNELVIAKADTDEIKDAKKAKVRSIKKGQRAETLRKEYNDRRQTWQKHAKKAGARTGTIGTLHKSLAPTKR